MPMSCTACEIRQRNGYIGPCIACASGLPQPGRQAMRDVRAERQWAVDNGLPALTSLQQQVLQGLVGGGPWVPRDAAQQASAERLVELDLAAVFAQRLQVTGETTYVVTERGRGVWGWLVLGSFALTRFEALDQLTQALHEAGVASGKLHEALQANPRGPVVAVIAYDQEPVTATWYEVVLGPPITGSDLLHKTSSRVLWRAAAYKAEDEAVLSMQQQRLVKALRTLIFKV